MIDGRASRVAREEDITRSDVENVALVMTWAGIDTLTGAVGRNGSFHGSGCDVALLPNSKCLGTKILEDAAWQKMALDVEGVLDGGVDREETLG